MKRFAFWVSGLALVTASPVLAEAPVIIYQFGATSTDAVTPFTPIIADRNGAIYGASLLGGAESAGSVFKLTPPVAEGAPWTNTVLRSATRARKYGFNQRFGAPVLGPNGTLYGIGTTNNFYGGYVYKMTPPTTAGTPWKLVKVFDLLTQDPFQSAGELASDTNGNLYAARGSASLCPTGCGDIVRLTPPGRGSPGWKPKILYRFPNGSQLRPVGALTVAADGALFGIATNGEQQSIFRLKPATDPLAAWTYEELISLPSNTDLPQAHEVRSSIRLDTDGSILAVDNYFATVGAFAQSTVFRVRPPANGGTAWIRQDVYTIPVAEQATVSSDLEIAPTGAIYFVQSNSKLVRLTPPVGAATNWTPTVLTTLTTSIPNLAYNPSSYLVFANGLLYGTTAIGGRPNPIIGTAGVAYSIRP